MGVTLASCVDAKLLCLDPRAEVSGVRTPSGPPSER